VEAKARKKKAEEVRKAVVEKYSTDAKVAKLCSGEEKCCSGRCLQVRTTLCHFYFVDTPWKAIL
jgi:hypothetical protein